MTWSERDTEQQAPRAAAATASTAAPAECYACAGGALAPEQVKAAFWQGDRLIAVDGIPALVCQTCGERYYEDETAMKLDFLRGTGFPSERATRTITVPVFDFDAPARGETGG